MRASEKWDKFVSGLKPKIQFEVRKSNCIEFEEATKIAMRIEAAFAGVSLEPKTSGTSPGGTTYEPMEIDNTEFRRTERSKQRLMDIRNNACFKCHKCGRHFWTELVNDAGGYRPCRTKCQGYQPIRIGK
eukprot:TRINITY_DN4587_c0_g1_i1.p1 TRINITY_DN4587_c0_g1~~TRINITY_DN4587_c0_g1_i1.p1  ORF type:complete len:130 (+),score=12.22 TRINITY_DN4587_c0_g1_i1:427-816(+)